MAKTYVNFILTELKKYSSGTPIYTANIASLLANEFHLGNKEAAAATAVAIKRIMDGETIQELRFYQRGIYYLTACTPFGELGIDKEKLIADKYLLPDKGYETGLLLMHRMGLTSQMPRVRMLATNIAKECMRMDERLGVYIKPPKVAVTAENKAYLQVLDVLEMLDKAPVDEKNPYETIAEFISAQRLKYGILLAIADNYYNRATVIRLAHTASAGGMI